MSYNREIVPYGSQKRNKTQAERQKYFALVNWGGSSEDDGYVRLASEVVQSCERIVLDARPDVLYTLRYLGFFALIVAVTAIVGYCLVQSVPHLLFLLSRILVDLPLGILSALCGLLVPLLNLVLFQLPLAIGHGVAWVLSSLLSVVWVVTSLLSVVVLVLYGALWLITSLLSGILWVTSSVFYFIFLCVTLPFGFLYSIVAKLLGF